MKNILYLNHVSQMGGGEHCLLNLMLNLHKEFTPVLVVQEPGPLSAYAEQHNIKTYFVKMRGWRRLKYLALNYLATIPRLKELVRDLDIALIHCNAFRLNPYAVTAARSAGIPCVAHIRWFTRQDHIRKFRLPEATLILAMSEYMAGYFKGSGAQVKTIYDGIDVSRFARNAAARAKIRAEFGLADNEQAVGMVAQLTERKGHKEFIRAGVRVQKSFPRAKFIVVGGAILDRQMSIADLQEYARECGAQDLIFTGHRDDVPDIFQALDYFVLPSHVEPFGLVVLEAMASGLPVVATRSGGPQEIIDDAVNGLLIPAGSAEAIAEKLIYLMQNHDDARRLADAGRKTVEQRFSIGRYVEGIENIYRDCLRDG